MFSSTFFAPFGGTTFDGQYGLDLVDSRSILPPTFCGGGGSWSPGMVMVAAGEPGGGTACCANDGTMADAKNSATRILRIGMAKSSPNGAMEHNLGSRCPL